LSWCCGEYVFFTAPEQAEACVVSRTSQGTFFGTGKLPRRRKFLLSFLKTSVAPRAAKHCDEDSAAVVVSMAILSVHAHHVFQKRCRKDSDERLSSASLSKVIDAHLDTPQKKGSHHHMCIESVAGRAALA